MIVIIFTGSKKEPIQVKTEDTRNIHKGQQFKSREPNSRRQSKNPDKRVTILERTLLSTCVEHTEPQV